MRKTLISVMSCILLVASAGSISVLAAPADKGAVPPAANDTGIWLVHFHEEPLAGFRGGESTTNPRLKSLKPTSPALTGARRLDVNSKDARAYRAVLRELREEFLAKAAQQAGRSLKPEFVFDVVNNAVALELSVDEARRIERLPDVAYVEREWVHRPMTDAGPKWIHADALWSASGGDGYRGEGRIVGIIDTGINADHPSFGPNSARFPIQNPRNKLLGLCANNNSAGCNNKLIGIYDMTTGTGDDERNDGKDLKGHGTHVASTAAGNPLGVTLSNGITTTVSGVAPRANIISYKACEEESKCRGAWTLKAIEQAVIDKVDVINYSIGGDTSDPWTHSGSTAMLKAREAGIVVVVSAGNEGPGSATLTAPADAPWVIGVANTSHDRANVARLKLSGGPTPRPGGGTLIGASLTQQPKGPVPIVYAGDYGSPLCAQGSNVDALPPSTSTQPWTGKPFSGEIVVCDRGIYARVIKGLNVKNAGGSGMVLVNMAGEGSSVVADDHELPATHLGYAEGRELKEWLSTGSGHRARIEKSSTERVPELADHLAASSGRGPISGDWLKPNLAAPGTDILAAYREEDGQSSLLAYMSGTSMASPHVAGAVLLLRQMHPDWDPSAIESALQGTARASVQLPDGVNSAGVFDAGTGVIDLAKAGSNSLVFPVSAAQFRNAKPSAGGQPVTLNLPSLVNRNCGSTCSFTRTVKNLSAKAEWRVEVDMPGGELTVTPSKFTLAKGATQTLKFSYSVSPLTSYGKWNEGQVRLLRTDGASPDFTLPVAIRPSSGNLPETIDLPASGRRVDGESGWADISLSGLVALPHARFAGTDLVEPLLAQPEVTQDPTPDEVYDNLRRSQEDVSIFRLKAGQSGRMRLFVDVSSPTARDIDLFVGRAASDTALPSEDTEICRSTSPQARERCDMEIDVVAGEDFWILVQNWKASTIGRDRINLQAALVPLEPSAHSPERGFLMASGPGQAQRNEKFSVRIAWDDSTMTSGETRWGHLLVGASNENPGGVGAALVRLSRSDTPQSAVVLQSGVTRTLRLQIDDAHERLFIDVPPNATRLSVKSRGDGHLKLYLAHDASPTTPAIGKAPPRSAAAISSTQAGANDDVSLSGSALKAGRWYVTPVNTGIKPVDFELTATIEYDRNRPQLGWGNWYRPDRDGDGFFLSPYGDGDVWTLAWYTYLQDGTPTWYGGSAPAPSRKQGDVGFDLYRYSWDGEKAHAVRVGNAVLSLHNGNTMWVSWQVDGEVGSQKIQRLAGTGCGTLAGSTYRPDGNWYRPSRSGYGFEVLVFPGLETYISYVYDGQGRARWVAAHGEQTPVIGTTAELDAYLRRGACPLCAYHEPTVEPVGSFRRQYHQAAGTAKFGTTVSFPAPMQGGWDSSDNVELLTSPLSCQ